MKVQRFTNHFIGKTSFPRSVERESRVFFKELDSGLQSAGMTALTTIFGSMTFTVTYKQLIYGGLNG